MNLRKFIGLIAFLSLVSTANAVTLVAGNSYQLSGNITSYSTVAGYTGNYSLTPQGSYSYFTVNFDNTISVILNLIQANGTRATLKIDKLLLAADGTLSAPAGVKVFPSGCKDIGDFFPVNNPAAFVDFTIAGTGHNINKLNNTFNLLVTSYYSNPAMAFLGRNNISFTIGGVVNPNTGGGTQIPEPMSISLLGMGLLGGAIRRKLNS